MSENMGPRLAYAGSKLQASGDGATQSWRVAQVLIEKVQYDSDGKLIARLKLHMPKEILDEIGNKMELVEAVTKLANMACDGPLKDCRNADERLERAKKFLPTAECETWMRELFSPQPADASPSLFSNANIQGPAEFIGGRGHTAERALQVDTKVIPFSKSTLLSPPGGYSVAKQHRRWSSYPGTNRSGPTIPGSFDSRVRSYPAGSTGAWSAMNPMAIVVIIVVVVALVYISVQR